MTTAIRWSAATMVIALAGLAGCETPPAQPLPPQHDPHYRDEWITYKVNERLDADADLSRYLLKVQTRDQVVTLQGTLPSEDLRARAEKITADAPMVFKVNNNINVVPGPPPAPQ